MATVAETWDRIHGWMEINAPKVLPLLNSGASEEKLEELEEQIGLADLPNDFKESYRIHNGYSGGNFFGAPNMCNTFLTVDEIIERWSAKKDFVDTQYLGKEYETKLNDNPEEIKCKWWDVRWIPFDEDGCGNTVSMDLAPTAAGSYGQVFQWYYDGCAFELYSSSFLEYLKNFADDLENDKYLFKEIEDEEIEDEENEVIISLFYKEYFN